MVSNPSAFPAQRQEQNGPEPIVHFDDKPLAANLIIFLQVASISAIRVASAESKRLVL